MDYDIIAYQEAVTKEPLTFGDEARRISSDQVRQL
jgi:hypothetical protein